MKTTEHNKEVWITAESVVTVNRADIEQLRNRALQNARRRMRLCAHPCADSKVHEMLIVHARETYVRPHKHLDKSESFHVVEGTADVLVFSDSGAVQRVISMGDYASGRVFYYRLAEPLYHSLIITSDVIVFHEVTNGPFVRSATVFAPWAPDESDLPTVQKFMERLKKDKGLALK